MQLSKTYRRTRKGRKIDWLPTKFYIRYREDIKETEEELIDLIQTTPVYPIEKTSTYKDWHTGEIKTIHYIYMVNEYLVKTYQEKLEALIWVKNNPHRDKDRGDYFALNYARNPSEWNHWTYTKRRRASDRELIQKIKSGKIDADEAIFYHKKKPVIYYW